MSGFILAIEVGGTYIRTGIAGLSKNIIYQKERFKKTGNVLHEVNINIIGIINKLINDYKDKKLLGIGISLAANVDRKSGIIKTWPNHPLWNGFPILDYLRHKFPVPIVIEDDANCGLLGEYALLNKESIKHLAYICIGTGVGCSLILNGSLYFGENGFAGELGHVRIPSYNTRCTCGKEGCLQSIISGPAMLKKYNLIKKEQYSEMESIPDKFEPVMKQCYEETVCVLANSIYNISMLLDVSVYILGGGVVEQYEGFTLDIQNKLDLSVQLLNRKLYILKAKLGEQAGIYGAIQLVKTKLENNRCYH